MSMRGTYYRWTRTNSLGVLQANILGSDTDIQATPSAGTVLAVVPDRPLSPDEARMIGVRLIEAAALADADRSIRDYDPR